MDALEPLRTLYDYNVWADDHVLDAAAALTKDELSREMGASFGSVRGNLEHIALAQALWLSRWTGERPQALDQLGGEPDLDALRAALAALHGSERAFVAGLSSADLIRELAYVDTQGNPQRRPLWQSLLQVVNHGTHHRAEIALVLTSFGKPPRQLDYLFFEIERAGGAPRLT
jgi:uncharacterized damage-inducible protein DinB